MTVALIVIVIVLIGILIFLLRLANRFPRVAIETLSLEDVIKFFKTEPHMKALGGNANLVAVAVKEVLSEGKTAVTLAIYDKKKKRLFEPKTHAIIYVADRLGSDVAEQFGDKQMFELPDLEQE